MYQAVGKRKSAVARVRLSDKGDKTEIIVNGKPMNEYFNSPMWQKTI
ncbi:MAG: 30S ribosomal protein S9, partial [Candidatus Diapherotrites archaeon CG_4_10_14_0_2_um_filter_31_5]